MSFKARAISSISDFLAGWLMNLMQAITSIVIEINSLLLDIKRFTETC